MTSEKSNLISQTNKLVKSHSSKPTALNIFLSGYEPDFKVSANKIDLKSAYDIEAL